MEAEKQTEKTAGNPNTEGTTVQTDAPGQEPGMKLFAGDKVLWIIIAALAVISVLVVYSSTAKMAYDAHTARSTAHFLRQQLLILFRLRSADHHRTQDQLPDIQPPGAGRLCRQRSADAGRLFHRRHDQRRRPLDSARSFPVPAFGSTQGRHRTVSGPAARRPAERDRQITDHPLAQPAAVEAPRPAQNLARGHVAHPGPPSCSPV